MRPSQAARRRRGGAGAALAAALFASLAIAAPSAQAAAPPTLIGAWAAEVASSSARLHAEINPGGASSAYHFDYITAAAYEANLKAAKDGFAGAAKLPPGFDPTAGSGSAVVAVSQQLFGLSPQTAYRYRAVVKNSLATVMSAALWLQTQGFGGGAALPDGRGWELVSPVDKNGAEIDPPETVAGGGVYQAAAQSPTITYSSAASFGAGQGAPQGSQYIATRSSAGWSTENITTPMLSGSYGQGPVGVPYQLFSTDLARGLLLNGRRCRGEAGICPVANPPLVGSGAPSGYQNYYARQADGSFTALIDAAALAHSSLDAANFELTLAGASEDLSAVVLSSCAALVAGASEVPQGEGCDPAAQNLYRASAGGLALINTAPGAALAAPAGAISTDGSRVYFTQGGDLYLREGAALAQVDQDAGAGGTFQTASADGSIAYFTKATHLYRYQAGPAIGADLTPSGEVAGVLGASADGSYLYFQDAAGLQRYHAGQSTTIAAGASAAAPANYPPSSGLARISADGARLAFLSKAPLGGYDNTDQKTAAPDSEIYLYGGAAGLTCISCAPSGARPLGPSWLPGAYANGAAPGSLWAYKPRALVANGNRLFFNSQDDLVLGDTNAAADVYQWEAPGTGSCTAPGGCLALLSSGKAASSASFLDASADGSDAYFLTDRSLVGADPGSVDLYDARIGGGFPAPFTPIPCEGDACQSLPSEPDDPAVTTLISGPGNPPVRYPRRGHHHKKHKADQKKHDKHKQKGKKSHKREGGRR